MSQQQQQPTIIDVANSVFGALELAQKRGTFSFQESANIFQSMSLMKQYFQKVAEQQQKAMAQQQAAQQKNLQTIDESVEEI